MTRRSRRPLVYVVAAALVLAPGCRSLGQLAYDGYAGASSAFTPNPVSMPAYFTGLAIGFLAGLPLCLLSWPLTLVAYPREDGGEYFISSALTPAIGLGTLLGSVLATPFYPFGALCVPGDQEAPAGPRDTPPDEPVDGSEAGPPERR